MMSNAPQSPQSRGVPDLKAKFDRLAVYEIWHDIKPLDFEKTIDSEVWARHWQNWKRVVAEMKESQKLAAEIRACIKAASESD